MNSFLPTRPRGMFFDIVEEHSDTTQVTVSYRKEKNIFLVVTRTDLSLQYFEKNISRKKPSSHIFFRIPLDQQLVSGDNLEFDLEEALVYHKYPRKLLEIDESFFKETLRCLAIDLLVYDLFKGWPMKSDVERAFQSSPPLMGFFDKSVFEFFHKRYSKEFNSDGQHSESRALFKDYLEREVVRYCRAWFNFLQSPGNERFFQKITLGNKPDTEHEFLFQSIEREYKDTYNKVKEIGLRDRFADIERDIAKFLLHRYDFLGTIQVFLGTRFRKFFLIWQVVVLVCIVFWDLITGSVFMTISPQHILIITASIPVSLVVVSLVKIGRKKMKSVSLILYLLLPRLIVAIASGWIVFFTAEELNKIDRQISFLGGDYGVELCIGAVLFFLLWNEIRGVSQKIQTSVAAKRVLVILAAAFFISFSAGLVVVPIVDGYDDRVSEKEQNFANLMEMVEHEVDRLSDFSVWNFSTVPISRKPDLFLLKRLIEIDTVDARQNLGDEILSENDISLSSLFKDEQDKQWPILLEAFIAKSAPDLDNFRKDFEFGFEDDYKVIWRNTFLALARLHLTSSSKEDKASALRFLHRLDYAIKTGMRFRLKTEEKRKSLPRKILLRTFLAMFIGIFLKLIIEDKTVTEPI